MDANLSLWLNVFVLLVAAGACFYVSLARHMD